MDEIDPNEIRDLATSIQQLAQSIVETKNNFKMVVNESKTWNKVLSSAVLKMKELPGSIGSSKDLWKAMTTDAKTFKDVQDHISKTVDKEWSVAMDRVIAKYGENSKQHEKIKIAHEKVNETLEDQFDLAEKILKHHEDTNVELINTSKLVKDWGSKLRNPGQAIEGIVTSLGDVPQKLAKAKKETGSWTGAFKKLAGDGIEKITGPLKALFGAGGFLLVGIAAAAAAVTGLFLLFKNFYGFLDKEVMPAMANFNKQIGGVGEGTGKLKSQMSSVGVEFQLLGYSFEEGARLVQDFAESFKSVELAGDTLKTAKRLIAEFGVSAQEAGALFLQFTKQGRGVEEIKEAFAAAEVEASAFGLPVNAIIRDMASAPEVMARFGTANAVEFAKATVKAQSYGLSIKDINNAFGEQMDTFDKTSEAAANLNAIFGTNINSYELMLETDPTKRMEMVRKELVKSGKEWDELSKFEQNVITQQLGVTKSFATLMLSSDKVRKELEAQKNETESLEKASARWDKGIGRIKRTLIAWGAELNTLMRNVTEFVSALMGIEEPGKLIPKITSKISKGFASMNTQLKDWTAQLRGEKESGKFIGTLKVIGKAVKLIGTVLSPVLGFLFDLSVLIYKAIVPIDLIGAGLDYLSENFKKVDKWLDAQASDWRYLSAQVDQVVKSFNDFSLSEWILGWETDLKKFEKIFDEMSKVVDRNVDHIVKLLPALNPLAGVMSTASALFGGTPESPATPRPRAKTSPVAVQSPVGVQKGGGAASGQSGAQAGRSGDLKATAIIQLNVDGKPLLEQQVGLAFQ